jgi:hypothetical protein
MRVRSLGEPIFRRRATISQIRRGGFNLNVGFDASGSCLVEGPHWSSLVSIGPVAEVNEDAVLLP